MLCSRISSPHSLSVVILFENSAKSDKTAAFGVFSSSCTTASYNFAALPLKGMKALQSVGNAQPRAAMYNIKVDFLHLLSSLDDVSDGHTIGFLQHLASHKSLERNVSGMFLMLTDT